MFLSKQNALYIFHSSGTKAHYRALVDREERMRDIDVVFREFSILRLLAKGIIRLKPSLVLKQFNNLVFFLILLLSKNKRIIIGIKPYDWRIPVIFYLLKKHSYFFHTSSICWDHLQYLKVSILPKDYIVAKWKLFIENAEGVFCVSKESARQFQKIFKASNVSVVNHAIPSSYVSDKLISTHDDHIRCLFVGRMIKRKGLHLIFKIIDKLDSNDFEFTFVGDGVLGKDVKKFCSKNTNCKYLGRQKGQRLRSIYDRHDVLLLPSIEITPWEELFGIVIIEGLSRGLIPYVTDHSGPKEILEKDFSSQIFLEENYVEAVVLELRKLQKDEIKKHQLKEKAYHLGQRYKPENIFKSWNRLLQIEV